MQSRRAIVAVLGLVATALAALWLIPRELPRAGDQPSARVVLIDASASARRQRPDLDAWLRAALVRQAQAAVAAGEELAVVLFGAELALAFGPGPPAELTARLEGRSREAFHPALGPDHGAGQEPDQGSELTAAVELATAELRAAGRRPTRLVLIGDGSYTGLDPAPGLTRLGAGGASFEHIELPAARSADLGLAALAAPDFLESGAPLSVVLDLVLRGPAGAGQPGPASLTLMLESRTGSGSAPLERARPVRPPSGQTPDPEGCLRWSERVDFGPLPADLSGAYRLRARVGWGAQSAASGRPFDALPENDHLEKLITLGERPLVGWLSGGSEDGPAASQELAAWLASALPSGAELLALSAAELPAALAELDLLVTLDRAPDELPAELMRSFLASGGGWFACAGWSFLAGWSPESVAERESAAALLPLLPDLSEQSPRSVIFLVDGSGSMAGEPFRAVREALARLVQSALPRDRIELCFFTGALGEPLSLTPGAGRSWTADERRRALESLLVRRVPGGTTGILRSLEQLLEWRRAASDEALVLLLSDGREREAFEIGDDKADERVARIRAELAARRTRLVAFAVGDDPDFGFLSQLLAQDQAPIPVRDLGDLGQLFRREVNRDRLRRGPDLALRALGPESFEAGSLAAELARALSAAHSEDWPPLESYARSQPAPGAQILWLSGPGEPLLAVRAIGRGRSALWTSAPSADWAPAWSRSGALLRPLTRALARGRGRVRSPRLSFEGRALLLSNLPPGLPARLRGHLVAVEPAPVGRPAERRLAELSLLPPGPDAGGDPRSLRWAHEARALCASARVSEGGYLRLDVEAVPMEAGPMQAGPTSGGAAAAFALSLPVPLERAPEFAEPRRRLAAIPKAAGGLGEPAPSVRRKRQQRGGVALLVLGLACLFAAALPQRRS